MLKNKKLTAAFILFAVWIYSMWSLVHIFLYPIMEAGIKEQWLFALTEDGLIKNLVWTLPAVLLIKRFSSELHIGIRELFSFRKDCVKYTLIAVALAAVVIGGSVIRKHGFEISPDYDVSAFIVFLFVGISEEAVFRGFFLNASLAGNESRKAQVIALLINAVMFLCIHFPRWIYKGTFVSAFTGAGFVTVMLLSCLFGYVTLKCRSIWPAVIIHSVYDLAVFIMV